MLPELEAFFARSKLVITKKTKRGMGESDIRPAIRNIAFVREGENDIRVTATISAQEPTLNPELIPEALRQLAPGIAPDFAKFMRLETYDADMNVYR